MYGFLGGIFILVTVVSCKLTCIGNNGEPVDMFILYKLPRIDWYETPPLVTSGHGYAYLDSNNLQFKLSDISIASNSSAAGWTLDQVYSKYNVEKAYKKMNSRYMDGPDDLAHVFYNDENPNGQYYFDCGHTKGALAFNEESGFWIITSVPKYPPPAASGYEYPHSGCMYGQMFMCITFNSSAFNDIGLQLRYDDPHVHDANLPQAWEETFPNMKKLLDGEMIDDVPYTNTASLTSLGGTAYKHFAKSASFHKDLYHDLVAPGLQANVLTETWQHGKKIGPSCDGDYTVLDIIKLNVKLPSQSFPFVNYDDHSKFVVGASSDVPYVCVGDINRQPTQFKRGGGTMCVKNLYLWQQFYGVVVNTTHCDNN